VSEWLTKATLPAIHWVFSFYEGWEKDFNQVGGVGQPVKPSKTSEYVARRNHMCRLIPEKEKKKEKKVRLHFTLEQRVLKDD
jgi:hypothetical protein